MKLALVFAGMMLLAGLVRGAAAPAISALTLTGAIEGENVRFELCVDAPGGRGGTSLPLVVGDVAYLDGAWPKHGVLERAPEGYTLRLPASRKPTAVRFAFASRPVTEGDWRRTRFRIPMANTRSLALDCDRADLEVEIPGALNVKREALPAGGMRVTASLGLTEMVEVAWKPQIRRLDAELAAVCDARSVAVAAVGALRVETHLHYQVIQGHLERLLIDVGDARVTRVEGDDIQAWHVDETGTPHLVVTLGRRREGAYGLHVTSETALPAFPCAFSLPLPAPRNVIRAGGAVLIGSDSAIRLDVQRSAGMIQVDPQTVTAGGGGTTALPARVLYAFQYANTPPSLALHAEDIRSAFAADARVVLTLSEQELVAEASIALDIREAPLRELRLRIDPDPAWGVTAVTGSQVSEPDVDVREEQGARILVVPLKQAVLGAALVTVRLERAVALSAESVAAPTLDVLDAESQRGYLVVAGERGVQLRAGAAEGLREVFTGALPMRVKDAQLAYRFKAEGWKAQFTVERTRPAIHSEVFHLTSLGEGIMTYSAAITYHIGGAPVQAFTLRVPADVGDVEFTGSDIDGWTREGDLATVRLRNRVIDDYTLLVSYDRQIPYAAADLAVGPVETTGTESEVGYLVVASALNVKLSDAGALPESVIPIERQEIPPAYAAAVAHPIVRAYRYGRAPHDARVRVSPYEGAAPLSQVAEYAELVSSASADGELVTTAHFFLKNASRQHLILRLPEGAKLWSIRAPDEQGAWGDLLSQRSGEGILVPMRRPPDPNTPLETEIVYAQSLGRLGFWRGAARGLRLHAPSLGDTSVAYLQWTLQAPAGHAVGPICGAYASREAAPLHPLTLVWRIATGLWRAQADGPGGRTLSAALRLGWDGPHARTVMLAPALAGEPIPALDVRLVPAWAGVAGSARALLACLGVGGVLVAAGRGRRSRWIEAAGLALLALGLVQSAPGQALAGLVLAVALGVVTWRLVRTGFTCGAAILCRLQRARTVARQAARDDTPPFEPIPVPPPVGRGGFQSIRVLLAWALVWMGVLVVAARADKAQPPPLDEAVQRGPVLASVTMLIQGPATAPDVEQSAAVTAELRFQLDQAARIHVAPPAAVMTECELGSADLQLVATSTGYELVGARRGDFRVRLQFRVPVETGEGVSSLALPLPPNLMNRVTLDLPEAGLDVHAPAAVWVQVSESNGVTRAEAVHGSAPSAAFVWRPRVRRTETEQAVVYADTRALATLLPGLVEQRCQAHYTIPHGEIREARLRVPAGLSVTSARADALASWSFDPATREVLVVLERPVSGAWVLDLALQSAQSGLPYGCTLGALEVIGAARQRGTLAVAAPASVQVRIVGDAGVMAMDLQDFSAPPPPLPAAEGLLATNAVARKAFRYTDPCGVSLALEADAVAPDLQVLEHASLSLSDERAVRSATLAVTVSKAGIFALVLEVPADYEVETLSGADVSHWDDEATEATAAGRKRVRVHLRREITDGTALNLVLTRGDQGNRLRDVPMEDGVNGRVDVPVVRVVDARRHTGTLSVAAERGTRLAVRDTQGVDRRRAEDREAALPGALVFDLLRPEWSVALQADVMAPLVKPSVLHHATLHDGMVHGRAYVHYRIENAGLKRFLLQAPRPGVSLTVTGRDLARVSEVDAASGTWEVVLHNKVQDSCRLTVVYQMPYETASGTVTLAPVRCRETEPERGYLVVSCEGRLRVLPPASGDVAGFKAEDARSIPATFAAGDLSAAVQCYRALHPDATLTLNVARHERADVLPAMVEQVQLESAVSPGNAMLTHAALQLRVGNHRFLAVTLPGASDVFWQAQVNGRTANVAREGGRYLVPLDESVKGAVVAVDLVYASQPRAGWWRRRYAMPVFELPVQNVTWTLWMPPGRRYGWFGGSLAHEAAAGGGGVAPYTPDVYRSAVAQVRAKSLAHARAVMEDGESLLQAGQQRSARRAFEDALVYSLAEADLNEDARVQLRNLQQQQWTMALVNRRSAVRQSRNIAGGGLDAAASPDPDGNYAQQSAGTVAGMLPARDREGLERVAARMIDQQVTAADVAGGIAVCIPAEGTPLRFARRVQVDPREPLDVRLRATSEATGRVWPWLAAFGVVTLAWRGRQTRVAVHTT